MISSETDLKTSGRWSYSTCVPQTGSFQRVANPKSTRYNRFSCGLPGCPSKKFSGFTSPCTYLWPREQERGGLQHGQIFHACKMRASHPFKCNSLRIERASTPMHATISWDMTCPDWFHTSHRLGPNMSMTCQSQRIQSQPTFIHDMGFQCICMANRRNHQVEVTQKESIP